MSTTITQPVENIHIDTTRHDANWVLIEKWDAQTQTLSYKFCPDFWNPLKHNTLKTEFEGEEVTCHEATARGMVRRFQELYNTGNFPEVV